MKWAELAAGKHIAGVPDRIMLDTRTEPIIPPEGYPLTIVWESITSGAVLDEIEVEEPGFVNVPGPGSWPVGERVRVIVVYADGPTETYP